MHLRGTNVALKLQAGILQVSNDHSFVASGICLPAPLAATSPATPLA